VPSLTESQAAFATALLDPALPVPPALRSRGAPAGADRFAVYRNNVVVGLIEGLREAYPVVCRLVGDEFFRATAGIFARVQPPRSPVMLEYGEGFAEFIEGFAPAASVPYLADVARLERAWVEAYHAAEAEPLARADAANGAALRLHPAVRLVCSRFPILTIWQANQTDAEPQPLELSDEGEIVLVTRPAAEVQACRVSQRVAALIDAVAADLGIEPGEDTAALCSLGAFAASGGAA
jgi:hypothetical protein